MKKSTKSSIAAPAAIVPFNPESHTLRIIIETPKGSRNKYAYDPKQRAYQLSRVLPAGMSFPWDFGFVPRTLADDGDPVDVLLLMDEPAFPGCVAEGRLIGVIEGEQEEGGKTTRNDRLLAVEVNNHLFANLRDVDDLAPQLVREIGEFFVDYHRLQGRRFRVLGVRGPKHARKLLDRSLKAA